LAEKHFREASEGEIPPIVSLAEDFGWVSVFSLFEARSALFHSPIVDTRPLAVLIIVLWFRSCLLRPGSSAVIDAWYPRARVFYTF
jgi:hypothetical protein